MPGATLLHEADISPESESGWRLAAEAGIGGAAFDTLVTTTIDGVCYGPIHRRRVPARSLATGAKPWRIVQRMDDPDAGRANAQALADLGGGADALALIFKGAAAAHGFGLSATEEAVAAALSGVMLGIVHLRVEPGIHGAIALAGLRRAAALQGLSFEELDVDLGCDWTASLAITGSLPATVERLSAALGETARALLADGFGGRVARADGRLYHEAGASEAQELGAALATALQHLRSLEAAGLDLEAAADAIGFALAADQRQFIVTAKLRALRLLWHRVLELSGLRAPPPAHIHVETSFRMMAAEDPHTNIVRTTVAAFAAVTGGADSLSVLPFTVANGLPGGPARRLARNVQLILREEGALGHVADPAAGSGGIEALTDGIAEAAWCEFQRIEMDGGIARSLQTGALPARIAEARRLRQEMFGRGDAVAIGVTLYPLASEPVIETLIPRTELPAFEAAGRALLVPGRWTEAFERSPR